MENSQENEINWRKRKNTYVFLVLHFLALRSMSSRGDCPFNANVLWMDGRIYKSKNVFLFHDQS